MPSASTRDLVQRIANVLQKCEKVHEAYLFGSQARGRPGPLSDVDVAVYVDAVALDQLGFGIAAELGSELQSALGRSDVDIVVLNQASPLLYHRVLRDGTRVCSRNPAATTTREGQALSRYFDYLVHLRKIEAAHRARIEAGGFGQ